MARTMNFEYHTVASAIILFAITTTSPIHSALADEVSSRGKYLVTIAGCGDCHTPGYFLGKPISSRRLGGSDVGFEIRGLGTFVGPNLTSDRETGLGKWSEDDIVKALQTGITPEGRELASAMPWRTFASLTSSDAKAIAAYLKSLPPVYNKVPGPFGSNEPATVPVLKVIPLDQQ